MQDKIDAIKAHYGRTPFDFQELRRDIFRHSLTFEALRRGDLPGREIVDVGCSVAYLGEVIRQDYPGWKYLGIDINPTAVAAARAKGLDVREGNNLLLDLPDCCSDLTVSEGVIHHTPDPFRCFRELIRITKEGGFISLYVYNRKHMYYYLHRGTEPVRRLFRRPLGRKIVEGAIFPLFSIFVIQVGNRIYFPGRGPVSREVAWNIFSDQVLTPVVHFFTRKQINDFAEENGLDQILYKPSINRQGMMFLFRKR